MLYVFNPSLALSVPGNVIGKVIDANIADLVFDVIVRYANSLKIGAKNYINAQFKWYQKNSYVVWVNKNLGYDIVGEDYLYKSYRECVSWTASISYKF